MRRIDSPQNRSHLDRALRAASSFFAGFAFQIVTLTGHLTTRDDDDNRWFGRGEWAAYAFLALCAALGLALLVSQL